MFQEISQFLQKYQSYLNSQKQQNHRIQEIIQNYFQLPNQEIPLTIKKGTITIPSSSVFKHKVFQSKDKLLTRIQEEFPYIHDIS